jgi:hypothetical protein
MDEQLVRRDRFLELAPVVTLQRSAGNRAVTRWIGLQRAGGASGAVPEPTSVPEVLQSSGRTLEASVRARMEESLGGDFSQVRMHTDTVAQRSAAEIGARAYTSGNHVVLGAGASDRHTLAHELWHVRQQSRGPVAGADAGNGLSISDPHDRFEREAEMMADRALGAHRSPARLDDHVATGAWSGGRSGFHAVQRVFFGSSGDLDVATMAAARRRHAERQRLNHEYGEMLGPKDGKAKDHELADDGSVRINPVWYRLEDFPRQLLTERKEALWHYSVGGKGEISIGTEEMKGVVEAGEWQRLLNAMREKDEYKSLTLDDLQLRLDGQGHPTIAAGFEPLGRAKVSPARVSGELQWNPQSERFEVSDKSGRYMSKKVRPGADGEQSLRWLTTVAQRMGQQWGVEIHPVVVKAG